MNKNPTIAPSSLFNEQVKKVNRTENGHGSIILKNFIDVENFFKKGKSILNIKNLTMIVKVTDSKYSIKYSFDKTLNEIHVIKILK